MQIDLYEGVAPNRYDLYFEDHGRGMPFGERDRNLDSIIPRFGEMVGVVEFRFKNTLKSKFGDAILSGH